METILIKTYEETKENNYKLIETRNKPITDGTKDNHLGKKLMKLREDLKKEILNNILSSIKKDVYIIGHLHPDADSIISSYILSNILKSKGYNAYFCILKDNYDYDYSSKKLLDDYFKFKPSVINNLDNKDVILVDHNNPEQSNNNNANVIGAFDHHKIAYKIDNIYEMEYAATALLIYDTFKNEYKFSPEEITLIGLAVLSDTDYLTSGRYYEEDQQLFKELNFKLDIEKLQKKYFNYTNLNLPVEDNINNNYKKYIYMNNEINRVLIYAHDNKKINDFIHLLNNKRGIWLLIWCDFDHYKTTIYLKNKTNKKIEYNKIISSTYLILDEIKSYL